MKTRGSGVLLHITSLPSPHGIGDFGSTARTFVDFLARTRQRFWQVLPLNPTDPMCGNSPYFSRSTFAMDPLFIAMDGLLEAGLISETDIKPPETFSAGRIDYDKVGAHKTRILEKAFLKFQEGPVQDDYNAFCSEHAGWLDDFALFTALKIQFKGKVWSEWPEALRDRRPDALKEAAQRLSQRVDKEKFLQWILFRQWFSLKSYCNRKSVEIIGDLPIYVSYDSADVWVNPHIFKLGRNRAPLAMSGVPPDYFSETGQLWNNPVYRWDVLKQTGYGWWIRRMAHTFNCFDKVRIDHFRGLVKYWEVPANEKTAINGEWKEVPTDNFFKTLTEWFPRFPVIAEDLGYITPDVYEIMERYGFPGMKVLMFAFGDDDPMHPFLPHTYPRNCVAYTGTHDNNTLNGWFENEATPQQKKRLFRYLYREPSADAIHWEMIRLVMMSVADMAVFPMQDILGLGGDARMNRPATPSGNWTWRFKPGQITPAVEDGLRAMTLTYGRGNEIPDAGRSEA
ncbi:MAG: 4-alpha-glucanotransferase [Deltaproteobacteria bacterium]|nr:4-alpha-glucanotransferase [Deltaproteobacteria bacterium]